MVTILVPTLLATRILDLVLDKAPNSQMTSIEETATILVPALLVTRVLDLVLDKAKQTTSTTDGNVAEQVRTVAHLVVTMAPMEISTRLVAVVEKVEWAWWSEMLRPTMPMLRIDCPRPSNRTATDATSNKGMVGSALEFVTSLMWL